MSTTWSPVTFYEIRVGDTVRTLDHRTGDVIATGQADNVVHCKNHDRIPGPSCPFRLPPY